MHVIQDNNEAKVWLQPIEVEYNRGYNKAKMNRILKLTKQTESKKIIGDVECLL